MWRERGRWRERGVGERERERKGVEKLEGEKKLKEWRGDGRNSELRMNRVDTRRKTAEEGFREH